MPDFSKCERLVGEKLIPGKQFKFSEKVYTILLSGKPSPPSGECKTDLYVLASDEVGKKDEFKFSIKKDNYEFLENKIKRETAFDIFGPSAIEIISDLAAPLKKDFEHKVLWKKEGVIERITLGWKLELFKETSRKLSSELNLSLKKKKEILTGNNRAVEKRNCLVKGNIITNSGVANWMMVLPDNEELLQKKKIEFFVSKIESIDNHLNNITINAGFTALSFFPNKEYKGQMGKWDGDRPLAVWIDWSSEKESLKPQIRLNKCFQYNGNILGEKMRRILKL